MRGPIRHASLGDDRVDERGVGGPFSGPASVRRSKIRRRTSGSRPRRTAIGRVRTELGEPIIVDPRRGLHDVTNPGLHDGREDAWKKSVHRQPLPDPGTRFAWPGRGRRRAPGRASSDPSSATSLPITLQMWPPVKKKEPLIPLYSSTIRGVRSPNSQVLGFADMRVGRNNHGSSNWVVRRGDRQDRLSIDRSIGGSR